MEILIGTSFVFTFVLLGALISLGNERQRRAIDGLREQTQAWAEQDIRIKRESWPGRSPSRIHSPGWKRPPRRFWAARQDW